MAVLADLLTFARSLIAIAIVLLAAFLGKRSFRFFILLLLLGWTSDILDGKLARSAATETSLGKLDFAFDVLLVLSSFFYLTAIKIVDRKTFLVYVIAIVAVSLILRSKSLTMLLICPLSFLPYLVAVHIDVFSFYLAFLWSILAFIFEKKRFFGVIAEFAEGFPGGYLKGTARFFERLSKNHFRD